MKELCQESSTGRVTGLLQHYTSLETEFGALLRVVFIFVQLSTLPDPQQNQEQVLIGQIIGI